jgi:hypothetical protein
MKVKTILKHVHKLEVLARRNHGRVPTRTWLNDNGFFPSYECMLAHPRYFKHLVRAWR